MPGEPLRHTAFDRHDVDVRVAVVLGAEGDQLPVRREGGIGFDALVGGQAPHSGAVEVGHPEIIGVNEGDVDLG